MNKCSIFCLVGCSDGHTGCTFLSYCVIFKWANPYQNKYGRILQFFEPFIVQKWLDGVYEKLPRFSPISFDFTKRKIWNEKDISFYISFVNLG